jgi:hypothetical protein
MTGMSSDAMRVSTYLVNSLIFSSPNLVLMLCSRHNTHTVMDEKTSLASECQKKEKVEELCTSTPRGCPSLKATRPFSENT